MYPLTDRVEQLVLGEEDESKTKILQAIKADLNDDSHVEHYLSHLGDLMAIAERSKINAANIGAESHSMESLQDLYRSMIEKIGWIVRYGYVPENKSRGTSEEIGTPENPIVEIEPHYNFIQALLQSQANLERRAVTTFFTTNYDTLLEDALALHKRMVRDGFSGGAVGYWNAEREFSKQNLDYDAYDVIKLHGSIDWHKDFDLGLVRARYGTKYLSNPSNIMIYPQATKYVETQKDPFASLFMRLRKVLGDKSQNTLICCGYSFGDSHINNEIEAALRSEGNRTTLIAFIKEDSSENSVVNATLDAWLNCPRIGSRVYVAGENGLYHSSTTPIFEQEGSKYNWWRFDGLTDFLKTGELA
tara:strand:- start:397 stop:1476 length:1080 start_codon:yes stop_codon:yes gene_type:complete